LTEDLDNGVVISKSIVAIEKYSYYKTRCSLYESVSSLFVNRVQHLHEYGYHSLEKNYLTANNNPINYYSHTLYKSPSALSSIRAVSILLKSWTDIKRKKHFSSQKKWVIGYYPSSLKNISLRNFSLMLPPKKTFWADPFVVKFKGETMLFFESVYNNGKGKIEMSF